MVKDTAQEITTDKITPIKEAFGVIANTAMMEPGEAGARKPALNNTKVNTPDIPPAITASNKRGFINT